MSFWLLSIVLMLNSAVSGKVVDAKGAPVPAAAVRLAAAPGGSALEALTELDGTFSFPDVPPGPCTLSIEMAGFEKLTRQLDSSSDESRHLSITLSRPSAPRPAAPQRGAGGGFPGQRMGPMNGARPAFTEVEVTGADGSSVSSANGGLTADSAIPARQEDGSDVLVINGNASASLDGGDWNDPGFRARMADMGQRMGFGEIEQMRQGANAVEKAARVWAGPGSWADPWVDPAWEVDRGDPEWGEAHRWEDPWGVGAGSAGWVDPGSGSPS